MSSAIFDLPFIFFNIAPYSPNGEEKLAADMLEYTKRTGNPYVLYSLSLHPEGRPARDKVERMLASYRVLKKCLQGTEVKLGILLQSILGHWARLDKDEEQWTRTVDIKGNIKRFCVLDKRFQDYILYVAGSLAAEEPCFILGDDDIRSFSPDAECFCPLHVAEFNRRLGTSYTPEQLRELIQGQKSGDREYDAFTALQLDSVIKVMQLLRQGIEQVNPDIPTGACMPGWHLTTAGNFARAIAGHHPAMLRLANSGYLERDAVGFPYRILQTQQLAAGHGDIPYLLDEADTFPHHLYSRSSTSMHAKLVSSILCGLKGAKLWFVNATKQGIPVNRNYTDILAKYRGFYPQLAKEVQETAADGIRIPCSTVPPFQHELFFRAPQRFSCLDTWADKVFGQFGIPFSCTCNLSEDAVYALAGKEMVQQLSDGELRQLFSGKLLIDGNAAIALSQRGFAQYMGVEASSEPVKANRDQDVRNGLVYPILSITPPKLTPIAEVEVTSSFRYMQTLADASPVEVAPSTVFYRNALGGSVCVSAYNMNYGFNQLGDSRKLWVIDVLNKLNGAQLPNVVLNQQNVTVLSRHAEGHDLIAVFNTNFDEMSAIQMTVPAQPGSVQLLSPEGIWQDAVYDFDGNAIIIHKNLHCYESIIVKCTYDMQRK